MDNITCKISNKNKSHEFSVDEQEIPKKLD